MEEKCSPTIYFLIKQHFNINYDIIIFLLQNTSIKLFSLKSMRINPHQVPILKLPILLVFSSTPYLQKHSKFLFPRAFVFIVSIVINIL